MIFSIIGLSILPAGRAIILAYTMPLWAIPIELWFAADRPRRGQLVGAAVGFAGLLLFMNPGLVDWGDWRVLAGNAMLLLAAASAGRSARSCTGGRPGVRVSGPRHSGRSSSARR